MHINNIPIALDREPLIIAEMSGNHNQSLERALNIVKAASDAGVLMLKLQTYKPDTMTLNVKDREFFISDANSLWDGNSLYDLYKKAYTPWEWHEPIMRHANKLGMSCFSTPFDECAVDFLESLDVPAYKIASFENIDLPLIRKVASTNKPIIISTGMATLAELEDIAHTVRNAGSSPIILLKCTSTYPANPANSNLLTIPHMRKLFKCEVGLSDHTMGIGTSIAAIAHGATVIEKHFTLRRADAGVDSAFSLEPMEMQQLIIETKRAWQSIGAVTYGPTKAERNSLKYRRSLYIAEDMQAGDVFNSYNLRRIRPGLGLSPKYYSVLLGKRVRVAVPRGTPVNWDMIS